MKNSESILIFTGESQSKIPYESERGVVRGSLRNVAGNISKVAVTSMENNMRQFISSLDRIIGASPKEVGGLSLDEIEIHANIDGKGNIGISGIASAEVAVQGGIKFILRRKL